MYSRFFDDGGVEVSGVLGEFVVLLGEMCRLGLYR